MKVSVEEIDGELNTVIEEVYSGLTLRTSDNENMHICMRNTGFEFCYQGKWFTAKKGIVTEKLIYDEDGLARVAPMDYPETVEEEVMSQVILDAASYGAGPGLYADANAGQFLPKREPAQQWEPVRQWEPARRPVPHPVLPSRGSSSNLTKAPSRGHK